jgi:hypothetical protein
MNPAGNSSYYPPRATWRSRFYYPWNRLQRGLRLDRIQAPCNLPLGKALLSLFIPGLSLRFLGRPWIGQWILTGYCLCLVTFIVLLGYPMSNYAFGMMISAHVTSLLPLLGNYLEETPLLKRLLLSLCVAAVTGLLVYVPLFHWFESRYYAAYQMKGQVLVVDRRCPPESLRRGDWMAYEMSAHSGPGIYARAGTGIDQVLAVAGDRIQFTPKALFVNGELHARHPRMPRSGEWVVPKKHWFVLPSLAIEVRGNVDQNNVDAWVQDIALVQESQVTGKVLRHWFGRKQFE